MQSETNERAVMGGNNPPEPTPFEESKQAILDLYDEAAQWLDGEPVTTQAQADALNVLQSKIREAAKVAEENRKTEAKPFDDGKKEVQTRYKPIQDKADKAIDATKAALKPYLLALARKQEEEARAAREEADRKQAAAMEAMRNRDASNLAQSEEAERLAEEAKQAEREAAKAGNAKAHAKGTARATGLRTVHKAVMKDPREAAAWVWKERNEELMVFAQELADKAVRSGVRDIAGFDIIEEKTL